MTVAAVSTPPGAGGMGVVRISGEDAIAVADRVFKSKSGKKLSEIKGYTALFGDIYDGDEALDECVALVFRSPKSYTGEDVVELSVHGGAYITKRCLRIVLQNGADAAGPGEFTKRAFLNGKLDLAEAESVMKLISAKGERTLAASRAALDGRLSGEIAKIRGELISLAAKLTMWSDAPDDDTYELFEDGETEAVLARCERELAALIDRFDKRKITDDGVSAVICGRPNVGKSTLMNFLSGEDVSIVTDVAGTTRDIVEETVRVGDIILRLSDTAGLHDTLDTVESIGVERARRRMDDAELVLAVFDASQKLSEDDINLINYCKGRKAVAILNKCDLEKSLDTAVFSENFSEICDISAKSGSGTQELEAAVFRILGGDDTDPSAVSLISERQRKLTEEALTLVREAQNALLSGLTLDAVNVSVDCAIDSLSALTGEKATESVVNEVFSKFCVGK